MTLTKRRRDERRSGCDRREAYDLEYNDTERRSFKERRSREERRKDWVRIDEWISCPASELGIEEGEKKKVFLGRQGR